MLSRLAQLCLRQSEAQTGSQLLRCLAAASSSALNGATLWPQQHHHHHYRQRHYTGVSEAVPAPVEQQQQPQQTSLPEAVAAPAGAASPAAHSRLAAAKPTQPAMQILKVLLEAEQPLSSHELHARVQQQYANFNTRRSFKAHLKYLCRSRWVSSKAPAMLKAGTKHPHRAAKGSDGHWLFAATQLGRKQDLNSPGKPLLALAMKEADEWTRQQLPEYAQHMREGRVPVTWQNLGVLKDPQQRQEQYQKHLLFGGGERGQQQQLGSGREAAASRRKAPKRGPQKQRRG